MHPQQQQQMMMGGGFGQGPQAFGSQDHSPEKKKGFLGGIFGKKNKTEEMDLAPGSPEAMAQAHFAQQQQQLLQQQQGLQQQGFGGQPQAVAGFGGATSSTGPNPNLQGGYGQQPGYPNMGHVPGVGPAQPAPRHSQGGYPSLQQPPSPRSEEKKNWISNLFGKKKDDEHQQQNQHGQQMQSMQMQNNIPQPIQHGQQMAPNSPGGPQPLQLAPYGGGAGAQFGIHHQIAGPQPVAGPGGVQNLQAQPGMDTATAGTQDAMTMSAPEAFLKRQRDAADAAQGPGGDKDGNPKKRQFRQVIGGGTWSHHAKYHDDRECPTLVPLPLPIWAECIMACIPHSAAGAASRTALDPHQSVGPAGDEMIRKMRNHKQKFHPSIAADLGVFVHAAHSVVAWNLLRTELTLLRNLAHCSTTAAGAGGPSGGQIVGHTHLHHGLQQAHGTRMHPKIVTQWQRDPQQIRDILKPDIDVLGCHAVRQVDFCDDTGLGLMIPSAEHATREGIKHNRLFVMHVELESITLNRHPCMSFEDVAIGDLLHTFQLYLAKRGGDRERVLNQKLMAMIDLGASIQQQTHLRPDLRDRYNQHLKECRRLREERNAEERETLQMQKKLFEQWQKVKQLRAEQGFISTPWSLQATRVQHDMNEDVARMNKEIEAEANEIAALGLPPHFAQHYGQIAAINFRDAVAVKNQLAQHWKDYHRPPGQETFVFQLLFADDRVTSDDALRSIAKEAAGRNEKLLADKFNAEILRRKRVCNLNVFVRIKVSGSVVAQSRPAPLHWMTWSTVSPKQMELQREDTLAATGPPGHIASQPFQTMDLAVHSMPTSISMAIHVGNKGILAAGGKVTDVDVKVPSKNAPIDTTHPTAVHQRLLFDSDKGQLNNIHADGVYAENPVDAACGNIVGELKCGALWPKPPGKTQSHQGLPPLAIGQGNYDSPWNDCAVMVPCLKKGAAHSVAQANKGKHFDERTFIRFAHRLQGLKLDMQDPKTAAALAGMHDPNMPMPSTSTALCGYSCDLSRVLDSCGFRYFNAKKQKTSKRFHRLRARSDRAVILEDIPTPFPAFERELLRMVPKSGSIPSEEFSINQGQLKDDNIQDFIKRVRLRSRHVSQTVTSTLAVENVVKEWGQELIVEESNWMEMLEALFSLCGPRRALKPASKSRLPEKSTKELTIHVQVIKLYNVPHKSDQSGQSRMQGYGGYGVPSLGYGAHPDHYTAHTLAQQDAMASTVVVEARMEAFDGSSLTYKTRAVKGIHPDMNQHGVIQIQHPDKEEITAEGLRSFDKTLFFNVYDVDTKAEQDTRETSVTTTTEHRRFLGYFAVPFSTLYAHSNIEGKFRINRPAELLGYELPVGLDGRREETYISLRATLDPKISVPDQLTPIVLQGKEKREILVHCTRWLDQNKHNGALMPLGTDLAGHSVLISRFISPTAPPKEVVSNVFDPHAIERVVRYVSYVFLLFSITNFTFYAYLSINIDQRF